ncbi:hypothetical protein BJ138DRAFT_1114092 [Hygrophoropsis aurantiaca]|uniref:Uncharacterized protein n=1 Tax=Hygrophoropsis aurantiaca TaxID=72124 RepID=A0ACB8ABH9_9AGAM|nr:hypothetical protein BJ138DRAFT_1114092 [Hygrophoropsis aurantiaca]
MNSTNQEVRFNSFGVPYIVEFGNVSFEPSRTPGSYRSGKADYSTSACSSGPTLVYSNSSSASSSTSSFCYISSSLSTLSLDSINTGRVRPKLSPFNSLSRSSTMRSASSFFKRKPTHQRSNTFPGLSHTKCASSPSLDPWHVPPYTPKPLPPIPPSETDGLYIQYPSVMPTDRVPRKRLTHLQNMIATAVVEAGMDVASSTTNDGSTVLSSLTSGETRGLRKSLFRGTYGQVMTALKSAGLTATPCLEEGFEGGELTPN